MQNMPAGGQPSVLLRNYELLTQLGCTFSQKSGAGGERPDRRLRLGDSQMQITISTSPPPSPTLHASPPGQIPLNVELPPFQKRGRTVGAGALHFTLGSLALWAPAPAALRGRTPASSREDGYKSGIPSLSPARARTRVFPSSWLRFFFLPCP